MTAKSAARTAQQAASAPGPDLDASVLTFGDAAEEPEYEELFKVRGKSYNVRVNPDGSMLLKYFDQRRKRGPNEAFSWALEQMVGEDGYAALLEPGAVPRDGFKKIVDIVLGILLGDPQYLPKSRRTT